MNESRLPKRVAPVKMQELAVLPLFYKLEGKKVLIAGSGFSALWKTELVAATGANISLFLGSEINDEHRRVFENLSNVTIFERKWQDNDFENCILAIYESHGDEDAIEFLTAAKKYNLPVNIIDKPKYCDFQFGAIVNRSPLVIGISTDGASPALGQQLRGRLELMLPQTIIRWLEKAKELRPIFKAKNVEFNKRRSFWHRFAKKSLDDSSIEPSDELINELLEGDEDLKGQVVLIGAGPGDPDFLTIGAMRALQMAEVILFDDLVSKEVLDFARREATFIAVGKRGSKPSTPQEDITKLIVKYAKEGKYVVRVKGGDALVFGRATEEIEACYEAGIPVKLVSGISAAQGAAASLGISLTDREYSQRVQFITGAGRKGGLPPEVNFDAVADENVTTFVYMPRATCNMFVEKSIAHGLPKDTPAAIIVDCTRKTQKNYIATVSDLPSIFASFEADGPELVMIGNVLKNIKYVGNDYGCTQSRKS